VANEFDMDALQNANATDLIGIGLPAADAAVIVFAVAETVEKSETESSSSSEEEAEPWPGDDLVPDDADSGWSDLRIKEEAESGAFRPTFADGAFTCPVCDQVTPTGHAHGVSVHIVTLCYISLRSNIAQLDIDMGLYWKKFGYQGPPYCRDCKQVFGEHMVCAPPQPMPFQFSLFKRSS
jgi:hypothetical protein